jgi:multidrug efflux pump subunit AcrA (membrane-fusion protein)
MKIFDKLFNWYGKKRVLVILIVIIALVFFGLSNAGNENAPDIKEEEKYPIVKVTTASALNNPNELSLVGRVRALSEVEITPDRSGRVTKVNTSLGQSVKVGQVIIELENAGERAALLQAEGAYEMARANSAQSDVGLREAEHDLENAMQAARNTNQNSFNTINNVILGTIDLFFANPDTSIPGLRIGGIGNTAFLNSERVAFQTILPDWKNSISSNRDLNSELNNLQEVRLDVKRTLDLINTLIPLLNNDKSVNGYSESEIVSLRDKLTSAQTQTTNTLSAIDSAYTALKNAKESLDRAKLSASGGNTSVSDAQIKQALGILRSAQANYEKTILRSPINGTVNELDVKLGEFVSASVAVAKIANNTKSEVVTFVSDKERESISVGDEVLINGTVKAQIAVIAPALDSVTQKIEVRIVSENDELTIGDTVRVTGTPKEMNEVKQISLPLTAVKFDNTDAFIFVIEDSMLARKKVEIGEVRGSFVNIISGIDAKTEFVLDARGKSVGEKIEVIRD